jgi:hypothetical protein
MHKKSTEYNGADKASAGAFQLEVHTMLTYEMQGTHHTTCKKQIIAIFECPTAKSKITTTDPSKIA